VNVGSDDSENTVSYDTTAISYNNFNDLFSTTGFTGGDSVAGGQKVSLALSSRLYDQDGDQRFKAQIGQAYFIDQDETVDSTGVVTSSQDKSDLLLDLDAEITDAFSAGAFFGYGDIDGSGDDFRNINFNFDYEKSEDDFLKFSYRMNKQLRTESTVTEDGLTLSEDVLSENSQFIAEGSVKVSPQWRLFGTQRYDLDASESLQTQLGAEYDACCWSLSLVADRLRKAEDDYVSSLFAQIKFSGLGEVATGVQLDSDSSTRIR